MKIFKQKQISILIPILLFSSCANYEKQEVATIVLATPDYTPRKLVFIEVDLDYGLFVGGENWLHIRAGGSQGEGYAVSSVTLKPAFYALVGTVYQSGLSVSVSCNNKGAPIFDFTTEGLSYVINHTAFEYWSVLEGIRASREGDSLGDKYSAAKIFSEVKFSADISVYNTDCPNGGSFTYKD